MRILSFFSRVVMTVCAGALLLHPADATAQISVLGHTVQEHTSMPGQLQSGTVLVANASAEPRAVRIYLSDYWFDASGDTRYEPPGTTPRSNAAWIALDASQVTVPPGGTVPVHYSVRTPGTLAAAGTFWSLVMVEPAAPTAAGPSTGQVSVATSIRYAVQVVNHVAPAGAAAAPAAAEISAPRSTVGKDGVLTVQFDLKNLGETGYHPDLSLELVDEAGHTAGTFRQRRGLLYPGTSLRQQFECRGIPHGTYKAVIVADTGDDVFGAQLPITW